MAVKFVIIREKVCALYLKPHSVTQLLSIVTAIVGSLFIKGATLYSLK